jgi:hypothetical protein
MSDEITFDLDPSPASASDAPAEPYRAPPAAFGYLKTIVLLALIFLPWAAIAFVARIGSAGH